MFHRGPGLRKRPTRRHGALYPLPIAKWTVGVLALIFIVIVPLTVHEYYLSILNLIFIAIVGALGLNILVGYTARISIGHGAFMSVGALPRPICRQAGPAILDHAAGGRHDGGGDRRHRRHAEPAHQGPLSRDRDTGRASSSSNGPSIACRRFRRRPGVDRGRRPSLFGVSFNTQGSLYFFLLFFAVLAIVATLNLRSRIGHASWRYATRTSRPRSSASTSTATS